MLYLSSLLIREVTLEAEVSMSTFYRHFDGKDELLDAIYARFCARLRSELAPVLRGLERASLETIIRWVVSRALLAERSNPGLLRAVRASQIQSIVERRRELCDELFTRLRSVAVERLPSHDSEQLQFELRFGTWAILGVLAGCADREQPLFPRSSFSDRELVEALTELAIRYLSVSRRKTPRLRSASHPRYLGEIYSSSLPRSRAVPRQSCAEIVCRQKDADTD